MKRNRGKQKGEAARLKSLEGDPWERQPTESSKAYSGFCLYRDGGKARSLTKVAKVLGKSHRSVAIWSARYLWVKRVDAFERNADREHLALLAEQRKEMRTRHLQETKFLQAAATTGMRALFGNDLSKIAEAIERDKISAKDLLRYLVEGIKLERLALGEPDTITEAVGGANESDRQSVAAPLPITFGGRIDDALALLAAARARAADAAPRASN